VVLRYVFLLILFATGTFGEWKRYLHTDVDRTDSPPARSLAYFRIDPCSRSDPSDKVLLSCSAQPSANELAQRLKTRTEFKAVGRVGSLTIYDLEYYFEGIGMDDQPAMRSVLIGKSQGQLHEIHVKQTGPTGTLDQPEILRVGREAILKIKSDDGGIYHFVNEDYFLLSERGAILLDFGPVFEAAEKVVPEDMVTYQPTSKFDFAALMFHVQTERRDVNIGRKVSCCEGRVEVPFRIERSLVVPGKAKYIPSEDSW
jgi:hypothetical protein